MDSRPRAIIIGAGFTGCALAYDLAQRGFAVDVLERGEIASGTSGRTHGVLHSGVRYCVTDKEAAVECIQENRILARIARQCIESNGGLVAALTENDLSYGIRFEAGAQDCGIPIEKLSTRELLMLEPELNPHILGGYSVPDASFDPLRLAMAFAASAVQFGAHFHTFTEVTTILINGSRKVCGAEARDRHSGIEHVYHGDLIVNATGAWAGIVAGLAGENVPVRPTPGIMVAYDQRVTNRVISRLGEPDDGDIIIPQRRMAVIGTTSFEVEDPDYIPVSDDQINLMHQHAKLMIPVLSNAKLRGVYMSARPLIAGVVSGRSLSRTFKCIDHEVMDGLAGFITITGGKATTCRIMAEKTADLACQKLGISKTCQTKDKELVNYHLFYKNTYREPI